MPTIRTAPIVQEDAELFSKIGRHLYSKYTELSSGFRYMQPEDLSAFFKVKIKNLPKEIRALPEICTLGLVGLITHLNDTQLAPFNDISFFHLLAKDPLSLAVLKGLLISVPKLRESITADMLLNCTAAVSAFYSLTQYSDGLVILKDLFSTNPELKQSVTADALFAEVRKTSIFYTLVDTPFGQSILLELFKANPELKGGITADTLSRQYSSSDKLPADTSVLSLLSQSITGRAILATVLADKKQRHMPTSPTLFSALSYTSSLGFKLRRNHLALVKPLNPGQYHAVSNATKQRACCEIIGSIRIALIEYERVRITGPSYRVLKKILNSATNPDLEQLVQKLKDFFLNEPSGKWHACNGAIPSIKPMLMKYLLTMPLFERSMDNNTLTLITAELVHGLKYELYLTKDFFDKCNIKGLFCFFENECKRVAGLNKPAIDYNNNTCGRQRHLPASPTLFSAIDYTSKLGFKLRHNHFALVKPLRVGQYPAVDFETKQKACREIIKAINESLKEYGLTTSLGFLLAPRFRALSEIAADNLMNLEDIVQKLREFFINEPIGKWGACVSYNPSVESILMKNLLTIPLFERKVHNNTLTLITNELVHGLQYELDLTKDYFDNCNIKGLVRFLENEFKRVAGLGKSVITENNNNAIQHSACW